jgi:hypothetical protein
MPVTYTIFDRGWYAEFIGSGHIAGDEIVEQKLAMSMDASIQPGYVELADFTAVTGLDAKPTFINDVARAAEVNQDAHRNSRTAIVVNRADFFDLARQYERVVAGLGMTVIVFNHRETAMLWLGRRALERTPLIRPTWRAEPREPAAADPPSAPRRTAPGATDAASRTESGPWGRT